MAEAESQEVSNSWVWKVWLGVFLAIYAGAKLHTWATFGSAQWFERHWLFWAAMVAWACLGWLVNWCVKRFGGRPRGPLD